MVFTGLRGRELLASSWTMGGSTLLDQRICRYCFGKGYVPLWHIIRSQSDGGTPSFLFARVLISSYSADGPTRIFSDVCSGLGAERIRHDEPFPRRCALSNP